MQRFQRIILCFAFGFALVGITLQTGCDDVQSPLVDFIRGGHKYTPAQVDRGRYLVTNLSLCGDCHTPFGPTGPDLNRLLAGGREFIPGALWTPNITPDAETGIGKWTDEQLFKAITQGIGHYEDDPKGKALFPIMPYYVYANMTPDDVMAIIAYLRTEVKPVKNEVPERAPFLNLPQPAQPLNYSSLPGDDADPGKYLTSAAGVCIECHTQRIEGGGPADLNPNLYFAGGEEFDIPGLKVASANITSHPETGIGKWTREEVLKALRDGEDDEGEPLCPPMPQFQGLTDSDLNDVVNFVRNLPAIDHFVEPCELLGPPPGQ